MEEDRSMRRSVKLSNINTQMILIAKMKTTGLFDDSNRIQTNQLPSAMQHDARLQGCI